MIHHTGHFKFEKTNSYFNSGLVDEFLLLIPDIPLKFFIVELELQGHLVTSKDFGLQFRVMGKY